MILLKFYVIISFGIVLLSINVLSSSDSDDDLPSTRYALNNDPPQVINYFKGLSATSEDDSQSTSSSSCGSNEQYYLPKFTNAYEERIICKKEINAVFNENLTPRDHAKHAIKNLTKNDKLHYYVRKYYGQFDKYLNVGGIPSVANFCHFKLYDGNTIEVHYKELETGKLPNERPRYIAKSTTTSGSFDFSPMKRIKYLDADECSRSIIKVFNAESSYNALITAFHYLNKNIVYASGEGYAMRYFATIHKFFELELESAETGFKKPFKFCDSLIKEQEELDLLL